MLRAQLRTRLAQAWPELEIVAEAENGEEAHCAVQPTRARHRVPRHPHAGQVGPRSRARASAADCHVVFVTAYDEYAVTAFEQGAVDYVLKPVDSRTHRQGGRAAQGAARRAARRPRPTCCAQLAAREAQRTAALDQGVARHRRCSSSPVDDVCYFQAEDKYTKVVTAGGEALITKTDQGAVRGARPRQCSGRSIAAPSSTCAPSRASTAISRPAAHPAQGPPRKLTGREPNVRPSVQGDVADGCHRRSACDRPGAAALRPAAWLQRLK